MTTSKHRTFRDGAWAAALAAILMLATMGGAAPAKAHGAQNSDRQLWVSRYDAAQLEAPLGGDDRANDLVVSPDGATVYVTGRSGVVDRVAHTDWATVAYDVATGQQRWVARYDGPGDDMDQPQAIGISPDGSTVFVTGNSRPGTLLMSRNNYDTVAYDAQTGAELWVARYVGPGTRSPLVPGLGVVATIPDVANDLAVSPDGAAVYVTGSSLEDGEYFARDYATVAYDARTGAQLWVARYGEAGITESAHDVMVNPDGSAIYVSGRISGPDEIWATIAYDPDSGAPLWVNRGSDLGGLGAVSPDGATVYFAGTNDGDYVTGAYDARTGARTWAVRYDGPANAADRVGGLAVSHDGASVFITGVSQSSTWDSKWAAATVAYDADTGARAWVAYHHGPTGAQPADLAVSPDDAAVYITGGDYGGNSDDYMTVAYDAHTGAQRWLEHYDGPDRGQDFAVAVDVSPDGSAVYISGRSSNARDSDDPTDYETASFATVAYDATRP